MFGGLFIAYPITSVKDSNSEDPILTPQLDQQPSQSGPVLYFACTQQFKILSDQFKFFNGLNSGRGRKRKLKFFLRCKGAEFLPAKKTEAEHYQLEHKRSLASL